MADPGKKRDRRSFIKVMGRGMGLGFAFLAFPGPSRNKAATPGTANLSRPGAGGAISFPPCGTTGQAYSDGTDCGPEGETYSCVDAGFHCYGGMLDDFDCRIDFSCPTIFECHYSFDSDDCRIDFSCPSTFVAEGCAGYFAG
jgi:hypothetical protein